MTSIPRSLLPLALSGALALTASPAFSRCDDVKFRLWQPGDHETWYEDGDIVELYEGEEGHLYVHVRARGPVPYSTSAELGYPSEFGLRGKARDVVDHVRMKAQSNDDRGAGRIRFTAQAPGETSLGYRLRDVKHPGSLDNVPRHCRTGSVAIRVVAKQSAPPPPSSSASAAHTMVDLLYRSFLRRDRGRGEVPDAVYQIDRGGRDAIFDLAATLTKSEEFYREAPRRAGRSTDDLLDAIYRDLYRGDRPSRDDIIEDQRLLDDCLRGGRRAEAICERFGRNLVGSRLFYDAHRDLVDDLDRGRRGGRRGF